MTLDRRQRLGQRVRRLGRHHQQRGAAAVDGWTLTFTWPTAWQSVNSGWSATWTQTGTTVTGDQRDGTLAAGGGTTTVGFVGAYSGPNVLPGVFTLNGTVCTTA